MILSRALRFSTSKSFKNPVFDFTVSL